MQFQQLGNTGVFVSRLCFGAMTFGGKGTIFETIGALEQKDADALVGRSLDPGLIFSIRQTSTRAANRSGNWRTRWARGARTW